MKDGGRGSKRSETPGPATACPGIPEGCQKTAYGRDGRRGLGLQPTLRDEVSLRADPGVETPGPDLLALWKMREPPGEGTGPAIAMLHRDSCRPGALTGRAGFT